MRNLFIAPLLSVTIASIPIPIITTPLAAQSTSHICMTRMTSHDAEFKIFVRPAKQTTAESMGYREVKCMSDDDERTEYIAEMCGFASNAPPLVQTEFKREHGATPKELCLATK